MNKQFQYVLFDLDGTLLDTAPDFVFALNTMLSNHGLPNLTAQKIREKISYGCSGLIELGFQITPDNTHYTALAEKLLEIYSENLTRFTRPFAGIEDVLEEFSQRSIPWGIVTDKPGWLTIPLIEQIKFVPPPGCVISGDSVKNKKPHPESILYACRKMHWDIKECLYIGDAQKDVQAAKKAGMSVIVAEYGYIGQDENPKLWQADGYIQKPNDLLHWL